MLKRSHLRGDVKINKMICFNLRFRINSSWRLSDLVTATQQCAFKSELFISDLETLSI